MIQVKYRRSSGKGQACSKANYASKNLDRIIEDKGARGRIMWIVEDEDQASNADGNDQKKES